jgi:capsular exopolysaccharide synthesis family protein
MAWLRWRTNGRPRQGKVGADDLSEHLATALASGTDAAEAYRSLRTNLLHALEVDARVIALTSSGSREGKSHTCAGLSVMLAQAGQNTLAVDCDFRKPELHQYFGLHNILGIVDVLEAGSSLQEVWHEPVDGLKVIPVGRTPYNPAELLDSRRFWEFLSSVREKFDYVLLDTPPLQAISDSAIIAAQADGVLLVLNTQNASKASVRRSLRLLEGVGANTLGTVINKVEY